MRTTEARAQLVVFLSRLQGLAGAAGVETRAEPCGGLLWQPLMGRSLARARASCAEHGPLARAFRKLRQQHPMCSGELCTVPNLVIEQLLRLVRCTVFRPENRKWQCPKVVHY
jgi:hypothetical protein